MAANLVTPIGQDEQPQAPQPSPMMETTGGSGAEQPNTAQGAAPQEPAAPSVNVPKELVKHPAFQALFAGAPPAVSYHLKGFEDRSERELFSENKDFLQRAGIRVYKAMSGERGVIYNALHIHPADLQAADKMGKLDQIAPDFDVVNHAIAKSGLANPILRAENVPGAPPRSRAVTIAPQAASQAALAARVSGNMAPTPQSSPPVVPSLPASAQRQLMAARATALQPGSPTSGPAPGQGRLLNSILKPVA